MQNAVTNDINEIVIGKGGFITVLSSNIETVLSEANDGDTAEIDAKLEELQHEILRFVELNARDGASSTRYDKNYENLAQSIHKLRAKGQGITEHNAERQGKRNRMTDMAEFLQGQEAVLTEYDDKLVRQLVERITVQDGMLNVVFKSGFEIESKLY